MVSPISTLLSNNKPWVTQQVKAVPNRKKATSRIRDREVIRAAQQEVTGCVKEQLQQGGGKEAEKNMTDGVNMITG